MFFLFNLALRPFRRWWRRMIVAAIVGTILMPTAREYVATHVLHQRPTITLPAPH